MSPDPARSSTQSGVEKEAEEEAKRINAILESARKNPDTCQTFLTYFPKLPEPECDKARCEEDEGDYEGCPFYEPQGK